jgi:hypothetical protein
MAPRAVPRPVLSVAAPPPPRARPGGGGGQGGNGINAKIRKWAGYAGTGANAFFKALVGFGDYTVSRNSIMHPSQSLSSQVPMIKNTNAGVIISHREYVTDVQSTSLFTANSYSLNPGVSTLFPWLQAVAQNFEEYEYRGMVLEFKSMSSDLNTASTTSNLGTVVMATQYNPLDPLFPDKRTMENYQFACSGKPSEHIIHPIECKKSQNVDTHLYVRTGPIPTGSDIRLYDLGTFTIATQGMPSAFTGSLIGELWVSYEVEFFKPKLVSTTGITALADILSFANGQTTNGIFQSGATAVSGNTCGCTAMNNRLSFPQTCHGRYLVQLYAQSATTGTTNTAISPSSFSNTALPASGAIPYIYYFTNAASSPGSPYTGVFNQQMLFFIIDVTPTTDGSLPWVNFSWTTSLTNWNGNVYVVQVPPNFSGFPPSFP